MKNMTVKTAWLLAAVVFLLMMAACPSPDTPEPRTEEYGITVKKSLNGTVSAGRETARAGEIITLTIVPDEGYKLASLLVNGSKNIPLNGTGSGTEKTFTMPAEDVWVNVAFTPDGPETYAITINEMDGGGFETVPEERQHENGWVTLIAQPDPGKKIRPGSLTVCGKDSGNPVVVEPDDDDEWIFEMPGEDVEVDADFIDEDAELYDIVIAEINNGIMSCDQDSAVAGDIITITLTIDDPDDYRYRDGSLRVAGEDDLIETSLLTAEEAEFRWTFTMPDEAVTIDAVIESIPYFTIRAATDTENGCFSISGVEIVDDYTGMAREGDTIIIKANPRSGYKLTDESVQVIPAGAVVLIRQEGQGTWVFDMADTDLEISVEFAELGPLEIYKGGAGKGISAGALSDDPRFFVNSVDMESAMPGRNGNRRALTITHALNANGNAVQQSFGLFSDTEIDLETVTALSFWAKANKALNIRYVGFGDADSDKRVVYTGEGFNQQIAVSAEWKHYIVPVPSPRKGQTAARVFLFSAQLSIGNYVCIDDIEFIQSGVTLTGITIPYTNNELYYGATAVEKILKGVPVKLSYIGDDGTAVSLQGASSSHTLKNNLVPWLAPFAAISSDVNFSGGVITPQESRSAFTLILSIAGKASNPMLAAVHDGLSLDNFEDMADRDKKDIQTTALETRGYLWHTASSGSTAVVREYLNVENGEIHSGLAAGNWRSTATAKNPRGGRNFEAKDAGACNTLSFWIKVTTGGNVIIKKNTVFTFELRNGGTLTGKDTGNFFARQFTYNPDADSANADDTIGAIGWQNITMPLSDFADIGLDTSAITGYAVGVVDNKGDALRLMLDDIVVVSE